MGGLIPKKHVILLTLLFVAFSISPASTTIQQESSFTLTNNLDEPLEATISARGALEEVLVITPTQVTLASGEQQTITARLTRTPTLPGGSHETLVLVEQNPQEEQAMIETLPAIAHRLIYEQPTNQAYITTRLLASSLTVNAPAAFTLSARNLGLQATNAQVTFVIREEQGVLHEETLTKPVPAQETTAFTTQWTPPRQGTYTVEATLSYEEQELRAEETFTIGERELEILSIETQTLEDVTQVRIHVRNKHNQAYRFVEANLQLGSKKATTPSITLQPNQTGVLEGFLETTITEDTELLATIAYPPNKLQITQIVEAPTSPKDKVYILVALLLLMILLTIGVYYKLR
ncbi:MAG: hypothetical protein ACMXYD_03285 [Candidatus Woesearchaeota archaeon]